ncbi:MAG: tRNA 2-selenouridine(34) synthase MnmH [Pseudomonadales bacterium]|nr:tRNA 2-selenouridine(34) synthase MnmH [Pseudomonadales bacterium]
MSKRTDSDDYFKIFLNDTPLMDVRAPIEANKGAFPFSKNRPLLDDDQRHQIGIRYKKSGEDSAIQLGLKLATPEIRAQRYSAWKDFCAQYPDGYLYCFRGGLRSRTTQQWLLEQGIDYPLVRGGYKAMRRFLLDQLEKNLAEIDFISISGPTGSGKTRVLKKIRHHVDFEGLAQHRGSAFGRNPADTQPSNIDWENAVSIALLKHQHYHSGSKLFIEDEGRLIGRVCMPSSVELICKTAPLIVLEENLENRVTMTREDYIDFHWLEYKKHFDGDAQEQFSQFVLGGLTRIQKRLGGVRYKALSDSFSEALTHFFSTENSEGFTDGIRLLLSEYYDPMYTYQFSKRDGNIVFRGNREEVVAWANKD